MPSRFVEVTGTLDELDIRATLNGWPRLPHVSGIASVVEEWRNVSFPKVDVPPQLQHVLEFAPNPPSMVRWMFLLAVLLLVTQVCVVCCHRRHILKHHAHAKRL